MSTPTRRNAWCGLLLPSCASRCPHLRESTDPVDSYSAVQNRDNGRVSQIDEVLEEVRRGLPPRPVAADLPALVARGALIVDIRPLDQRERDGELPGAL